MLGAACGLFLSRPACRDNTLGNKGLKESKSPMPKMSKPKKPLTTNESEIRLVIGDFVMAFSQLEFTIRDALSRALSIDEKLFDAVSAPYDFAILCTVAKAVFRQELDAATAKKTESILNSCQELNSKIRVPTSHGTWLYGGGLRHVSRGSLEPKFLFEDIEELSKAAVEARRLMSLLVETIYIPGRGDN